MGGRKREQKGLMPVGGGGRTPGDHGIAVLRREFGQLLRSLRVNQCLSQEVLGYLSGCHRTYVGMLERGLKSPSLDVLVRLSRALNTRPSNVLRMLEERLERTGFFDESGRG